MIEQQRTPRHVAPPLKRVAITVLVVTSVGFLAAHAAKDSFVLHRVFGTVVAIDSEKHAVTVEENRSWRLPIGDRVSTREQGGIR